MSKFEVGQKWRMRNREVVTVVYINSRDMVVERENISLCLLHTDGRVLQQGGPMWEDLIEQVVEPKYRPFANAAEFDPYRDRWIIDGTSRLKVVWYSDANIELGGHELNLRLTKKQCSTKFWYWKEAFEKFTFEDGSPFGVEVK